MFQPQQSSRPTIILLSLEQEPWLDEMYSSLLTSLKAEAEVTQITDAVAASDLFKSTSTPPQAVIATDGALTKKKYANQTYQAVKFVREGGATLVFGLHFPSFSRPSDIKDLFKAFHLPWESGDYHRTDFDVNASMQLIGTTSLVPRYSQKALHVKNVKREDAVYLPSASSRIQSRVFAPEAVGDLTQTPAALTKCGSGRVGYLGDVNAEVETDKVVLAMCGLLD